MKGLLITKQITLSLTADDWELYSHRGGCDAAIALNTAIEEAVNQGLNARETLTRVLPVFRRYEDLGAMDSEPMYRLEKILDAIYGGR